MKRWMSLFLSVGIWILAMSAPVSATPTPYPDPVAITSQSGPVPEARSDATMIFDYDPYTGLDARNIIYLYGGRGLNSSSQEIFLDLDGQLRTLRFTHTLEASHWGQTQADLFKLNGLGSSSIQTEHSPPLGRFAHCSTIISTVTGAIVHDLDTLALREHRRINYLVFGGKKQINENVPTLMNGETENWEVTDELYVCAEYEIGLADKKHIRYHWYRVSPSSPQAVWPSARYDAQMIPLFNEETEITDGEYPFLIFGGRDASNNILQDAYIGVFKRVTVPAEVAENEWTFDMGITVEFTAIGGTSGHTNFKVFGAGLVYDPYYGPDGIPRVIMAGGRRNINFPADAHKVISITPTVNQSVLDWSTPVFNSLPDLPEAPDDSRARIHCALVLNPRDHRLRVVGGEKADGSLNPGILDLDLTDSSGQWDVKCTTFAKPAPLAIYANGTRIFTSENSEGIIYWDQCEATLEPPEEPFVWDVMPNADYGLDRLETITNTTRLHSYDTIRIHQTRSESGKVNDCYLTNAVVPSWISKVTLEGVVENGVKPVLYNLYSPPNSEPHLIPFYRDLGIILYCAAPITLRNITFCHSENLLSYSDPFPEGIPQDVMNKYTNDLESMPNTVLLELMNRYCDFDDDIWDLARHHVDDMALHVHTPFDLTDCEFRLNGSAVTLICVSSAIRRARISHSLFRDNFIGVVALEKEHELSHNVFIENYLAGVAFDKGSRAICRENLFTGNGRFSSLSSMESWQGAILSGYCITSSVPLIMTPWIYNNTFVDNYRALSVTDAGYRSQFMNRPFVFSNIISGSDEPIYLNNPDQNCDLIGYNNCFWPAGNDPPMVTENGGIMTGAEFTEDPEFAAGSEYKLSSSSPCLNAGLFTLEPGVMSEMNYPDYGTMDIGFHQPPGTGIFPGAPSNLQIAGTVLSWNVQAPSTDSFLLIIETAGQDQILTQYLDDLTTFEFDFSDFVSEYDHLFFWILSHINRSVFSAPVMIEWQE